MNNDTHGVGGSFVITPDGDKQLVHRTEEAQKPGDQEQAAPEAAATTDAGAGDQQDIQPSSTDDE